MGCIFLKVLRAILITFVVLVGIGAAVLLPGQKQGKAEVVGAIDLATIEDGTYEGEYKNGRWSNRVKVVVLDNKITDISIVDEHDIQFPMKKVVKQMIEKVIEKQSLDVDAVSGSTITAKAYLKSIEDALTSK